MAENVMISCRVPVKLFQEITKEVEEKGTVVSDYLRSILTNRKAITQGPPPDLKEYQDKISALEARLNKANQTLKQWSLNTV